MGPSQQILWKIYAGVLGALTTVAVKKGLEAGWKAVTGEEPPEPNDPETPAWQAFTWAAASGVGMGVAQLLVHRFTSRRWQRNIGTKAPGIQKTKLWI
ncbi:DUF4235 domain-containing protein [Parenemella sanctibonifatiensis]|uniref:DUF4235 domain-containing protein n=1 Tax=Parenemella sanctibonifatiensis TaxID=2016505 RepID=A0A255EE80_9ACTN|nr:DUF4235 domain-containing protein [Parenemella sanctibonifatiensis]OYN86433.1 hypothetical protein CGZ92_08770 [Parenemella sanctibonifatiensis]